MNPLHFVAALSSCISLVCLLLALGTDYWLVVSRGRTGLWKICDDRECYPLGVEFVAASLHAIRTFMCLGMIAGFVSLGGLCIMNRKPFLANIPMSKIACYASITAAICSMIAMSIFTGKSASNSYGWSFDVGWSSFALYLLTGCLTYALHRSTATIVTTE